MGGGGAPRAPAAVAVPSGAAAGAAGDRRDAPGLRRLAAAEARPTNAPAVAEHAEWPWRRESAAEPPGPASVERWMPAAVERRSSRRRVLRRPPRLRSRHTRTRLPPR